MEMPVEARPDQRSGARSRSPRTQPSRPPPPSAVTGINDLQTVQQSHDSAFKLINSGLSADEQGRVDDARSFYQSGLQSVNKVLSVNCDNIRGSDDEKNQAKLLQQKLNKTKLQIEYRLQALRSEEMATPSAPESMDTMEPPSYEDATRTDSNAQYAALGDSIMADGVSDHQSLTANATEIYSIPDGVQIFYITPEGYVSAPSYPTALKICKFNNNEATTSASNVERPAAFLQVGDWFYPLQPGSSPALQSTYGAYLFPDTTSQNPGSAVGLMMPDTVSSEDRQDFEQILGSLTMLQQQQQVTPTTDTREEVQEDDTRSDQQVDESTTSTTSTKIAKGLITAAEYISWGVGKGAEKAGEWMKQGSDKLKTRMKPEENPKPIDPRVQTGIRYARKGSHVAVQVSSYIVTKLGQATMALAREAAPHIRKQGEKMLPKSLKTTDGDGKSKFDGVLEVAASGLHGFGTVYMSLEHAAKALGKNLADQTVNVVSHKYGSDAGQLTENALYATGNLALTAHNANNLGIKAVAKRAAKDTGKAVLNDLSEQRQQKQQPPQKPPPPSSNMSNGEKR
ncbi:Spartin [Mactra antiquata]